MESEGIFGIVILIVIGVAIAALIQGRNKDSGKKRVQPDRPTPGGTPGGPVFNKKPNK